MGQQIIKGIEQIRSIISKKKFLLVRDKAYDYLPIKTFFDTIPHVEFSEFTSNPLYEQVCVGIRLFNQEQCEMLVAVGGGSAIDVAKCIKLYCKMDNKINYLEQEAFDSNIPLIAIPTTAGTGSESTRHAVIYYKGEKQSISHASIVPDYAVLEPAVLKTLPVYQKKCTMLDALCQAIESWWSVNSNDESISYSQKAIAAIRKNWADYIYDESIVDSEKIMEASNYAGRAINITSTTAAHAMSYKITSMYGFPHGHAVAICLPEVWKYMLEHTEDCIDIRGEKYLRDKLKEISSWIDLDSFSELIARLEMEYPRSGNREHDIKILVNSVNPIRLGNNPVSLGKDALQKMYNRIIQ